MGSLFKGIAILAAILIFTGILFSFIAVAMGVTLLDAVDHINIRIDNHDVRIPSIHIPPIHIDGTKVEVGNKDNGVKIDGDGIVIGNEKDGVVIDKGNITIGSEEGGIHINFD